MHFLTISQQRLTWFVPVLGVIWNVFPDEPIPLECRRFSEQERSDSIAEMGVSLTGPTLCYDWLYADLTVEQRETIREALVRRALRPALEVYRLPPADSDGEPELLVEGYTAMVTLDDDGATVELPPEFRAAFDAMKG